MLQRCAHWRANLPHFLLAERELACVGIAHAPAVIHTIRQGRCGGIPHPPQGIKVMA